MMHDKICVLLDGCAKGLNIRHTAAEVKILQVSAVIILAVVEVNCLHDFNSQGVVSVNTALKRENVV